MRYRGIVGLVVLAAFVAFQTRAQVPKQLSYQGVLTDTLGVPRPDGSYSMTFRLYGAASGGAALWTEAKNVTVRDGIFSTYLGDVTAFPGSITWAVPYWISTQVGAGAELSPRIKLASSAYSLNPAQGGTAQWKYNGTTLYYDSGKVFIGRSAPISGNEVFGTRGTATAKEYTGMYVEGSDAASWPFYGYATNGAFRAWTYYDGDTSRWRLYLAGIRLTVPATGGLRIGPSADYSLVIENSTGNDGIRTNATGDDAIQLGSAPNHSNYGVYIPSPGVVNYGLWPNTQNASGQWALYTVDNIEAGNVFASEYSLVAKVGGTSALTEGDVVAAAGLADPIPGSQSSLPLVRLADNKQFAGVVGVVKSRMVWEAAPGKDEMSMHSVAGPAQPGDYVALTVMGVAQVKVDPSAPISVGQRLTAAEVAGSVRPLKTREVDGMTVSEGTPVIGVALGQATAGSRTIPVHITLR
ncbi:MAG: DUF2190 family protein [Ignavibacteriae bacterium]|nr:DUF2190 family protein [Ignavibacteriota bacterium]